ncbi:hypothetical protein MZD04_gp178 [Pseudomonas phage Psa21]|uniref:Uncharacterized protein n=1 Tax=Pseudomonas phage Psa21 TaxID=2530023 RepID=A0A481W5Q4_9CAUD|nr:hypothetical protein MZD04_gp178 [Pseudomonas phage Psa21]QBJ02704.1 hypothetical protein PSA21_178 [Pseudomonas phage Psa21]
MTKQIRLRKVLSQPEWFMTGKRKFRAAKKIADRNNRRRAAFRLFMSALFTPMLSEKQIRVIKGTARKERIPQDQMQHLYKGLIKHKRAGYKGVIVRVKMPNTFTQSVIVKQDRLDAFIRDNRVYSYRDQTGEHWLEAPKLVSPPL